MSNIFFKSDRQRPCALSSRVEGNGGEERIDKVRERVQRVGGEERDDLEVESVQRNVDFIKKFFFYCSLFPFFIRGHCSLQNSSSYTL